MIRIQMNKHELY